MNIKNILKDEFIGSDVEIVDAKNKSLIKIKGKIVNETKNTFCIKTQDGEKIVLKNTITFTIIKNNQKIKINGEKVCFRPEDRIKKTR